jgi:hypothetical protein
MPGIERALLRAHQRREITAEEADGASAQRLVTVISPRQWERLRRYERLRERTQALEEAVRAARALVLAVAVGRPQAAYSRDGARAC